MKNIRPQVNFRVDDRDMELLQRASRTLGLSVSGLCAWSARLYAMSVLTDSTPALKGKVDEVLRESLGPEGREELRARFSTDFKRFERFFKELKCESR